MTRKFDVVEAERDAIQLLAQQHGFTACFVECVCVDDFDYHIVYADGLMQPHTGREHFELQEALEELNAEIVLYWDSAALLSSLASFRRGHHRDVVEINAKETQLVRTWWATLLAFAIVLVGVLWATLDYGSKLARAEGRRDYWRTEAQHLRAERALEQKECDQRVVRARTETREIYDRLRVSWQTDTAHLRRDWGACENELEACRRRR